MNVRRFTRLGAIASGLSLALAATLPAIPCGRDAVASAPDTAYEGRILREIAARDPEAARLFAEGSAAYFEKRLDAAEERFVDVLERQPDFVHAIRRLSIVRLAQGNRPEALALARRALAIEGSWENRVALARALVAAGAGGQAPSPADLQEARRAANRAAVLAPDEPSPSFAMCEVALALGDIDLLASYSRELERTAPDEIGTWVLRTIAHAARGRSSEAKAALSRARALGLDDDAHGELRAMIDRVNPIPGLLAVGGKSLLVWGLVLLALVGSGSLLSLATLRRARTLQGRAFESGAASGIEVLLRRTYGAVLWLLCLFFYASIPLLVLVVLALGGGVLYAMLALGHVQLQLAFIAVVLTAATVYAVLRSLFARADRSDPGRPLDLERAPRLRDLLVRVAGKIGTRPVDTVYLTPGVDLAVMERGGLLRQIRGKAERCLILGIGVLDGFHIGPFKAVLAHEYGHFSNRDTAGGGFALTVRRSVLEMGQRLAQSGAAGWFNPAWLFVNGFYRAFLRISHGASRLQEILADRWAAIAYGARSFADGLRHVIERSVRFEALVQGAAVDAAEHGRAVPNLYVHVPQEPIPPADVERAIEEALNAEPTVYDSHPSPRDRFAWTRDLQVPEPAAEEEDHLPVWSLFDDREALELEMTAEVSGAVAARYGIDLVAGTRVDAGVDGPQEDESG